MKLIKKIINKIKSFRIPRCYICGVPCTGKFIMESRAVKNGKAPVCQYHYKWWMSLKDL